MTVGWQTGTCDAGGVSIHFLRTGGAGPPLILLHGLIGNGACWAPVTRCLERNFDVVMPDARGHGRSSAPAQGYQYDDHANDVVALIRELALVAPILVGHSMGGMTAALVASRMGDLIRGVILVDPTFLSPERQREVYESDVAERHRLLLSRSEDDVLADLRVRHQHRSSEILGLLAAARLQTKLNAFEVLTPPNPEYAQVVSRISVPVLIVLGSASVVSIESARELQHLSSRIHIEQIPQAGHGLPYDQPERLASVVKGFVDFAELGR